MWDYQLDMLTLHRKGVGVGGLDSFPVPKGSFLLFLNNDYDY